MENRNQRTIPIALCYEWFKEMKIGELTNERDIEKSYELFKKGFLIGYDIGMEEGILENAD